MVGVDVPAGAPADVCELEYCSALRQTQKGLRLNGSLTARDIQVHLLSRHSMSVSLDNIEQSILVELAGGTAYEARLERSRHKSRILKEKVTSKESTRSTWSSTSEDEDDQEEDESDVAVVDRIRNPLRNDDREEMVVSRTTPLDLVQQTALLLIPELQRINVETNGRLPYVEEPRKPVDDIEEQAPAPKSKSCFTCSPFEDSKSMDIMLMIEASLLLICEEAGIEYGVELTVDVMHDILQAFSEDHWDHETVVQMVHAAGSSSSSSSNDRIPVRLDCNTFLRALTADLSRYRTEWRDKASTHVQDVNSNERVADVGLPPPPMTSFYSLPSIDYTADAYSNYIWAVLGWFLFMITFLGYLLDRFNKGLSDFECDVSLFTDFGCEVLQSSAIWLEVLLRLVIMGFLFIYIITLGNAEFPSRFFGAFATVVSMAFIAVVSVLTFRYEVDTLFFNTFKVEQGIPAYYVSLVTGIILLVLQLVHIVRTFFPHWLHSRVAEFLAPSPITLERRSKHAAEFKVCRLIRRALSCHYHQANSGSTSSSPSRKSINYHRLNSTSLHGRTAVALHIFSDQSLETQAIGSLWWILKSYWDGNRLAWQEGLWISPRLLWANLSQCFVISFTIVLHFFCVQAVRTIGDPVTEGLSLSSVLTCLTVGVIAGVAAQIAAAVNYVPSAITQTFKFRGGLLGSLHDKQFNDYRSSHDSVGYLFGSALWGAQIMGLIIWAIVALVMLLFMWDFTRPWMLTAVAQLLAFALTITTKNVVLLLLRRNWYAGFYRTKPGPANVMTVIVESWFLGLSTGYIISRAMTLFVLSLLYVGRIDTPFLAEGVGFGFDRFPAAFRTDILLHEAHRHPYMERWMFLYLIKLRHGSKFGTRAGAAWRILLTLALMPWLRKYRVYPAGSGRGKMTRCKLANGVQLVIPKALQLQLDVEELRFEQERRIALEEVNKILKMQLDRVRGSNESCLSI